MSDTVHRMHAVRPNGATVGHLRNFVKNRPAAPVLPIDGVMIAAFTETLRAPGFWACEQAAEILRERLMPSQTLQDAAFSPAARLAGAYWSSDAWSFLDVTLAVSRLKRLFAQEVRQSRFQPKIGARSILLSAAPGEVHDFGLHYVELAFEHAGYAVDLRTGADEAELSSALVMHKYDIVALSLADECLLDRLTLFIGTFVTGKRHAAFYSSSEVMRSSVDPSMPRVSVPTSWPQIPTRQFSWRSCDWGRKRGGSKLWRGR